MVATLGLNNFARIWMLVDLDFAWLANTLSPGFREFVADAGWVKQRDDVFQVFAVGGQEVFQFCFKFQLRLQLWVVFERCQSSFELSDGFFSRTVFVDQAHGDSRHVLDALSTLPKAP